MRIFPAAPSMFTWRPWRACVLSSVPATSHATAQQQPLEDSTSTGAEEDAAAIVTVSHRAELNRRSDN
eukprot:3801522-Alexandrium_andersonii.AAC.1